MSFGLLDKDWVDPPDHGPEVCAVCWWWRQSPDEDVGVCTYEHGDEPVFTFADDTCEGWREE